MDRRQFSRNLALGAFLPGILSGRSVALPPEIQPDSLIRPRRLIAGDKVGLITPGSFIPDAALEKAVNNLEELGFSVVKGANIRAKRGYNAGTDQQRIDDLHRMFADPEIKAVWCARGGYGCSRLLPYLDYNLIRQNPKVLIGYSDITALLQAIFMHTGLVGFHGPVAGATWTEYAKKHLKGILMNPQEQYRIELAEEPRRTTDPLYKVDVIQSGKARGRLMGGNLSLLAATAGTPFALDASSKLIFLEDVEEKPYRVDRMLTQLRQACELGNARGVVLGVFSGCVADPGDETLSLAETVRDRLGDLGVPVMYGFSFGHISNQCTLPVGIEAELDAENQTVTLLEPAVIDG
ncbi:MAG: LD-carboxypeptidase [Lewinellaceae bacterium]|nr:LD-carboxypeptidase [Lewinellaceae bacterium]